jgi:hypothetical protein
VLLEKLAIKKLPRVVGALRRSATKMLGRSFQVRSLDQGFDTSMCLKLGLPHGRSLSVIMRYCILHSNFKREALGLPSGKGAIAPLSLVISLRHQKGCVLSAEFIAWTHADEPLSRR